MSEVNCYKVYGAERVVGATKMMEGWDNRTFKIGGRSRLRSIAVCSFFFVVMGDERAVLLPRRRDSSLITHFLVRSRDFAAPSC